MASVLAAILVGALGSVVFVGIVVFLVWFFLRRYNRVPRASETMSSDPFIPVETHGGVEPSLGGAGSFDMEELQMATSNFSPENFIGEGRFGRVYRGVLQNGTIAAIKMRSGVETDDFADEARYLSSIRHQNLVTLLGHCQENNLQCLVYEYIPNGSVPSHLFSDAGQTSRQMLEFKHRLSIAIGAAKGLAHLHSISPRLLHRDFKTVNVLVGESFEGKVADAGIHIFLGGADLEGPANEIFLAPEVTQGLSFSEKSDVYSFGIFLLELVSGRQAMESPYPDSSPNLVEWLQSNEGSDEISGIIGERVESIFTVEGMEGCIQLVLQCVDPLSGKRPVMSYAVKELEQILRNE